ncbi:MAG: hypothetical protein HQ472_02010 [Ignavibacteria bacterium]|nr:hypothetical protein [Ignavibacteria bacterium]
MKYLTKKSAVLAMIVAGIAVGMYFIFFTKSDIEGWYSVRDTFVDSTARETAVILFVEVPEYDSVKLTKVAEFESDIWLSKSELNVNNKRTLLFHFFKGADTAALSDYMVDELSYTNPSIADPASLLQVVPHGWVLKVDYAPNKTDQGSTEIRKSQFYMPRAGVHARDLRPH